MSIKDHHRVSPEGRKLGAQMAALADKASAILAQQGEPDERCKHNSQEPVAYAIFAENGNIRVWSTEPQHVKRIAQEQGLSLVKLYATPIPQQAQPEPSKSNALLDALLTEIDTQCGNGMIPWKIEDAYEAYTALTAAPIPQPEREPLSDAEIQDVYLKTYKEGFHGRNLENAFARAIEAAHGIKQGGV